MKLAIASTLLLSGALASAPIFNARIAEDAIEGAYIVKYHEGEVEQMQQALSMMEGGVIQGASAGHVYNINDGEFIGFSANLGPAALHTVADLPGVEYIEQDVLMHASVLDHNDAEATQPITQAGLWGLDRNDGVFNNQYQYADEGGAGATVYILDTGIRTTHNDFGGRARSGANCLQGGCSSGNTADGNGHGTHCAGTVGGTTYGIAKRANLVAVKVLGDNGSGSTSGIVAGMNWAASNCPSRPCILSMSLGGGFNSATNSAVTSVFNAGSLVVAASGNSNANSCNFSPASANRAFAVNSAQRSGNGLTRSSFSNYGSCSEIFSAGSNVLSASHLSNTGTRTLSGTSMACPHVAGAAAICKSQGSSSPTAVWTCLSQRNQNGVVGGSNATPNIYHVA